MKLGAGSTGTGLWHAVPLAPSAVRTDEHGRHRALCGRYVFLDHGPDGEPVLAVDRYSGPQPDGSIVWEQLIECRWCDRLAPAARTA